MSEGVSEKMSYYELITKVKEIALAKLDSKDNIYLISMSLWLFVALEFLGELSLISEFENRLSKAIKEYNNYGKK